MKGEKIILPKTLWKKAIEKAHQGGHPGETKLKARVRSHFWIPELNQLVKDKVSSCRTCQLFTPKTTKEPIATQKTTGVAWEEVSVDLFGPLPNKKQVLVVQDTMSRFPAAKIVPSTAAAPVLKALDEVYTSYGQPERHRTDNGPPFNSAEFATYSQKKGIEHVLSYPYHPQGNPCETFMKPLGKALKTAFLNRENAQKAIDELLKAYRSTPHPATKLSPGNMLFRHGYHSDFPRGQAVSDEDVNEAVTRDREQKLSRKEAINSSAKRKAMEVQVGNIVLLKQYPKGKKFSPTYSEELYVVTQVDDKGVTVQDSNGKSKRRHKDDIKTFVGATLWTEEEEESETTERTETTETTEEAEAATENVQEEANAEQPAEEATIEAEPEIVGDGAQNITPPNSRPQRTRVAPSRFKDYVMNRIRKTKVGE
jgi:transposase InsO family protein